MLNQFIRWGICSFSLLSLSAMSADIQIKPGTVVSYTYVPKSAMTSTSSGSSAATLQVQTEGSACTATETDNTAINAAYDRILTCSGGTWRYLKKHALNQVVENAACDASSEGDIAKDATGLMLSCQSGVWKKASGGSGTGLRGLMLPLAGKSITCSYNVNFAGMASVDANGNLSLQAKAGGAWTNCGAATSCSRAWPPVTTTTTLTPTGIQVTFVDSINGPYAPCTATWPAS